MRETLSKSSKTKLVKPKGKVAASATRSTSRSRTRTKAVSAKRAKVKVTKRIKTPSAKVTKPAGSVKKSVKTKAAKPVKAAASKSLKTLKPLKTKAVLKKPAATIRTKGKAKKAIKVAPKSKVLSNQSRKPAIPSTKIRPRTKNKVTLPLVITPPPLPPEPPRRQMSSAVLRAFEQAVKVFNRRHYEDAKSMFENLLSRYPNEVEIIARVQTFIQVCTQRMAHSQATPRNAEELYDRGVFALNIGDFSQAKTFFEKALRLRPDEAHLLYSLAATHAQTGSHEAALEYLNRSIQIQPRFRAQALNDSDFSMLRENKRFLELLGLTSPFERLEHRR